MPDTSNPQQTTSSDNGTRGNARRKSGKARRATGSDASPIARAGTAAKTIVGRQLDAAVSAAAGRVGNTASTVRGIGSQLRDSGDSAFVADVVHFVAGYGERFASYLEDNDSDTIIADLERYGRRYPVAVAGAAFVGGLVASRFVKVSSAERFFSTADEPATYDSERS